MISAYLESHNISCYKLSKKSGIPYTTINEIVRGERQINSCSVSVLLKLSKALELSLDKTIEICSYREPLHPSFAKCFWDTNFKEIDPVKQMNYVVPRLLEYGLIEGFKYVDSNYSKEELKMVALNSREMSPKIANFLSVILQIKKSDMRYYKYQKNDWR